MKIFNILKNIITSGNVTVKRLSNFYSRQNGDTSNRPTTANVNSDGLGGLRKFLATSAMTTGMPLLGEGHIIHLDWDTNNYESWASQIACDLTYGELQHRGLYEGTWSDWYLVLSTRNTADYVVEQGTNGNWTYRKWNSGVSECWGNWSNNVTVNSSWGVLYEGKFSDPISYPSGLFLHTPTLIGSISGTAGFLELSGGGDNTKTGLIYIVRPYSTANSGYQVNFHAFGNYK